MEDIHRLRLIIHHLDIEDVPDLEVNVFGRIEVQHLAFSLYNANRDQRREPWLSNGEPANRNRVLLWLKAHMDVLYDP